MVTRVILGCLIPLGMAFTFIAMYNERTLIKVEEYIPMTLCEELQYELEQASIKDSAVIVERCKERYS